MVRRMGRKNVMKKLFSLVAMAAAISFASCTGNKAGATAEEACDSTACQQECGQCPVKVATTALAAALEAGNAESITQTLKDIVAQAGELAKAGKTEGVDELVQNAMQLFTERNYRVDEATAKAAEKVDEATNKAAEKIDEAAQKAAEKIDEAADKTKKKLGL